MSEQFDPAYPGAQPEKSPKKINFFMILSIILFVLIAVSLGFIYTLNKKANQTEETIKGRVDKAVGVKSDEAKAACEVEKRELVENPWQVYKASPLVGSFSFQFPKSWSRYEEFDLNSSDASLRVFFNPIAVSMDANLDYIHSALQMDISKSIYSVELKKYRDEAKKSKSKDEETDIKISGFDGKFFRYKDLKIGQYVGVAIIPYRDNTMIIKTDNHDKYKDYFDKLNTSLIITP